jgi:DNA primase
MSNRLPPEMLRRLRNEIPITLVIAEFLKLPIKVSEGYFRFLCPLCTEFITATNPKTNLARCFLCQKNFNPIDIVMVTKQVTFRNAVDYLANIKSIKTLDFKPFKSI